MGVQVQAAADMLFPSEGNRAANIKFYGGDGRMCADRLAAEFLNVEAQIEAGQVEPNDGIDD